MNPKNIILLLLIIFQVFTVAGQKYNIPSKLNPIVEVEVTPEIWEITKTKKQFNLSPINEGDSNRLVVTISASKNPKTENALEDLTIKSFSLVESLLSGIIWSEDSEHFDIDEVSFIALDGYGYYINPDGSSDLMSTSIILFMPDEINILSLVFFGTPDSVSKWEEEIMNIIKSIQPISS